MTTYYASQSGGETGLSQSSPFKVSDFWTVANPGDTLNLLDGVYTGLNSMIDPPDNLNGTSASPITVKALNDGKVTLDGQYLYPTIMLRWNNYFIVEGVNAHNSSECVVTIENAQYNIIRRVCAWDAKLRSTAGGYWIFYVSEVNHNAKHNLIEDCAGWGNARIIFLFDESEYNTLRRCFALYNGEQAGGTGAGYPIHGSYYGTGNIVENCIATVDMFPNSIDNTTHFGTQGAGILGHGPPNEVAGWNTKSTYYMYGNIYYRKSGQKGTLNYGVTNLNYRLDIPIGQEIGHSQLVVKDFIMYQETNNGGIAWNGFDSQHLRYCLNGVGCTPTQTNAPKHILNHDYKNITVIGTSPEINIYTSYGVKSEHRVNNVITTGGSVGFQSSNGEFIGDYIWAYGNTTNFSGGTPTNYKTSVMNTSVMGGDILQYRLTDATRPKVNGQNVGAQIKYRYVNGVLTTTPLWPWPMNQRIIDAMTQSGRTPIDVTKTVFELGGGTVPDFTLPCEPTICDFTMTY